VMTAENRDAGIWSYNTASDEATLSLSLTKMRQVQRFNDPEEPGEWEPLASSKSIPVPDPVKALSFDVQAHTVKNTDENTEVLNGNHVEGGQNCFATPAGEKFGTQAEDVLFAYQKISCLAVMVPTSWVH